MKTIFDFGMYDAADTQYYLDSGFRVVAVEANPIMAARGEKLLADYVKSGQLTIINAAIADHNKDVELTICGDDLGSSSILESHVADRYPGSKYTVQGITVHEILEKHGVPYYLKIDLEGIDEMCVRALTSKTRPEFLSFEIGKELAGPVEHLVSIGFQKFKIINQCTFREMSNESNLRDRIARKIVRMAGFAEPTYLRRNNRYFAIGHSSGPAPWLGDGAWQSPAGILSKWAQSESIRRRNVWYDLHAQ